MPNPVKGEGTLAKVNWIPDSIKWEVKAGPGADLS